MSANTLDRVSGVNTFIKCNYWMTWSSLYFNLAFDALPHCVIYFWPDHRCAMMIFVKCDLFNSKSE